MGGLKLVKLQSISEIYAVLRRAVMARQPVTALYDRRRRVFCPHRLGYTREGEPRVLCYQSGGESKSGLKPPGSPENWRCIAVDRLQKVKPAPGVWRTAPNHSRPQTCVFKVDVDADDYISVEEIDRKDIG